MIQFLRKTPVIKQPMWRVRGMDEYTLWYCTICYKCSCLHAGQASRPSPVNVLPPRHTQTSPFRPSSPTPVPFHLSYWFSFPQMGLVESPFLVVVLTCLKLSPGIPESTSILGQCTLVYCCSSAVPRSEGHSSECWGSWDAWCWLWQRGSQRNCEFVPVCMWIPYFKRFLKFPLWLSG